MAFAASPADGFRVSFEIAYEDTLIGSQEASFEVRPSVFRREIAPARTFALLRDVQGLREQGLALGGSLENAPVFNEGRLKGWTVGGNYRWRSANTIGYQRLPDATGAPVGNLNVSRPLRGKEFWDLGAMVSYQRRVFGNVNLRTQLNIQNLPNWQTPRLVKSDYDTNGVYGTTNAIVPVLWEIRRPRNYVLTATFEF